MVLWIVFAFMTAAAIFAACWPFVRRARNLTGGSDLLVYKDQLREIDRDRTNGLIGESEAEAARLEVSRRLLAAANASAVEVVAESGVRVAKRRHAAILTAAIMLALGVPGLYVAVGSPNVPGEPAFARVHAPEKQQSITGLVGQVEANLARNPNDGTGWEVIAPVYLRLGRFDDAVQARKRSAKRVTMPLIISRRAWSSMLPAATTSLAVGPTSREGGPVKRASASRTKLAHGAPDGASASSARQIEAASSALPSCSAASPRK